MHDPNREPFSSYGAFALKARYQHNFVLSQLSVTGLIAVALAVSILWPQDRVVSIPIELKRPDSIIVDFGPVPKIEWPIPTNGKRPPKTEIESYIVPEPVPDDEAVDTSIYTRHELSGMHDGDSVGVGEGVLNPIDTSLGDHFSESPEFTICEIPPEILETVAPDYPALAQKAGLTGKVTIQALVDTSGSVRKVIVAKSSGVPMLDAAAEKAAWKCRYKPGVQSGRPIRVWVTYPVVFKLSE